MLNTILPWILGFILLLIINAYLSGRQYMPKYIILEKEVGQTPLQAVEIYKAKHPEFAEIPMAYAGRLDPMASGKLLILDREEREDQLKI